MLPLRHRLSGSARQHAAAHQGSQQASAHLRLHLGDGGGRDPGGGSEDDPTRAGGVEHAVDDLVVKMKVGIERRAEAVDEGHRAEMRRRTRTRAVRPQALPENAIRTSCPHCQQRARAKPWARMPQSR